MASKFLNKLSSKLKLNKSSTGAVIGSVLVIALSVLTYLAYKEYEKTIVVQEQQQMMGIAQSISRSIDLFISNIEDSIKIVTLDKDFVRDISDVELGKKSSDFAEELKSYYKAQGEAVDAIYFFDKNGKALVQYPVGAANVNDEVKVDISTAIIRKNTYIGKVYFDKAKDRCILNIYEPVFDGNEFEGVVSVAIRLDVIFNRLIAPVKIGEKGYAMVKDQNGTIIMHTVKEQVGMNVIDSRKQMYPDLDYQELEDLVKEQLTGGEGTAIYHSYWWGDNVLKKAKKLNAYTPVKFEESFWVVAVTMSYDEIQAPINEFLVKIIGIATLIAAIISIFIFALLRMKKNKEELEKETKYLKMLNESSEQLRKKEAEMYHSNKLKMIGTLAGGIAHDINNLLTPIYGYSELLLMTMPKNSEYYEEVDEIYKASQKGKDLIEQILLFSRSDNGISKVEPININKVTKETIKLFKAILPKNVKLKESIKENCGFINASYTQIHQVIFNLCTNAFQAIKDKPGIIEISLDTVIKESLGMDRQYVELTIRDNGCGMNEETKNRIFDPFFTTKDIGEGTGLGLFVAQNIIDKYAGQITVESEIGVGSCFRIYLPLIDEETCLENSCENKNILVKNKRILIVDDNQEVIKVLRKGLEHLGYEVVAETNSRRALEMLQTDTEDFDLVITDYMMPDIKGSELAAAIKQTKEGTGVILMSGYIDEKGEELKNSGDFDGFISKPIELAKLSELIKNVLDEVN